MTTNDDLKRRARALQLHGLLAHWDEVGGLEWVEQLIEWEGAIRQQRSHERRLRQRALGGSSHFVSSTGHGQRSAIVKRSNP